MADETIRITVDDQSISTSDTTSEDIQSSIDELNRLRDIESQADTSSVSQEDIQQTLNELDSLSDSASSAAEELASLDDGVQSFTESVSAAASSTAEELSSLDALFESYAESISTADATTEELNQTVADLTAQYTEQRESLDNLQDAQDEVAGGNRVLANNIANTFRQMTNMGRAAGIVSVRVNQMAQAGAVITRTLGGANLRLALFVASIAGTIIAMKAMKSHAENLAKEIGGFSADVVRARAAGRIQEIEDRMRLGREIGEDAGGFIEATNEMSIEIREFKRETQKILLPIFSLLTRMITIVLSISNEIIKGVGILLTPVTKIAELVDAIFGWLLNSEEKKKFDRPLQEMLSFFNPKGLNIRSQGEEDKFDKRFKDDLEELFKFPEDIEVEP